MKQIVELQIRNDRAGSGYFGAPRGNRVHEGIDYVCHPGELVLSPVDGQVTKHGYCYSDDLSYRYAEITDMQGLRHRVMYCKPLAPVGDAVLEGTVIGRAQDVSLRHPDSGMQPHIHYEILDSEGTAIDPEAIWAARGDY